MNEIPEGMGSPESAICNSVYAGRQNKLRTCAWDRQRVINKAKDSVAAVALRWVNAQLSKCVVGTSIRQLPSAYS